MSFADELRKPNVVKKREIEDRIVDGYMVAIREECLYNKKDNKNYIKGYIRGSEDEFFVTNHSYFLDPVRLPPDRGIIDYDYVQKRVIQGIKNLGFTQYNVMIKTFELKEEYLDFWQSRKTRPNGKIARLIYVEIKW